MKRIVTVKFRDGNKITVTPNINCFGLLNLRNGMSLNIISGILYKEKDNIICGENITYEVDTIEVSMEY